MDAKSGYNGSAPQPSGFGPPPPYLMGNQQMSHQPPPPGMQYAPAPQLPAPPPVFGAFSQNAFCPQCNQNVATKTNSKIGIVTIAASIVCCLVGVGACGCFLLPFCLDSTRDVEHSCTKCGRALGIYRRL